MATIDAGLLDLDTTWVHVLLVTRRLPNAIKRRLAVEADVDPRTLALVYAGARCRTAPRRRALRVLVQAGYMAPESAEENAR